MATPAPTARRSTDLELAGLHLRLGALALARAELETLAGRDALDDAGLVDLAEARWRTGDVAGAGEAAHAVMDEDGVDGPLLALVVAAEAAMARGRPTESRRFAGQAMAVAGGTIDAVFAGMPRAQVWPADPAALPQAVATLFDMPGLGPATAILDLAAPAHAMAPAIELASMGLWDADGDTPPGADTSADIVELPAADGELELGRVAMAAGQTSVAAIHLGLVLRVSPALAPAVLDALADDRSPDLAFVRGDAYRLVGYELDARRAFAQALPPLVEPLPSPGPVSTDDPPDAPDDPPSEGAPA
ncbi:MAG: hypothetical protein ABIP77_05275 [Candidatus Limnocylindrales bacterium]